MIRTLGVDLAGQDVRTATCEIEWTACQATVLRPISGRTLGAISDDIRRVDWTGIDAPFGWPEAFVKALAASSRDEPWPTAAVAQMRHRLTDIAVHDLILERRGRSLWPLSVSSDRIAVCAWRCAQLVALCRPVAAAAWNRVGVPHFGGVDGVAPPTGPGKLLARRGIVESYPAGALAMWELPFKGYKARRSAAAAAAEARRWEILSQLLSRARRWLIVEPDVRDELIASDDALDAFICALVAYAAAAGRTYRPGDLLQRGVAQREGWIHIPEDDALDDLALAVT